MLLGIVGESGSGKSTLAGGVQALLGEERAVTLCLDHYHRYDRAERRRRGITALHPDANDLALALAHLDSLRAGERITRPTYDHSTGTFASPEPVEPRPILIVYGLLGYYSEALASRFDLRVFLDPEPRLRERWKVIRDTSERGYTEAEVRELIARRRPDSERFVRPQAERADLLVRFEPRPDYWQSLDSRSLDALVVAKAGTGPELRELTAEAEGVARGGEAGEWLRYEERVDGGGTLRVGGGVPNRLCAEVEDALWRWMPEVEAERSDHATPIGTFDEAGVLRHSNALALVQLLVTSCLVRRAGAAGSARSA